MLKITPYLWILLLIIVIGGFWFPILGYSLPIVFAALLIISPFKGRWFCGNLCPRGSFNDFFLSKFSLKKKTPKFFRNFWLRLFLFFLMMGLMVYRLIGTKGLFDKIGMVFVLMWVSTTLIAIFFGAFLAPRTWCFFCPMGTVQKWIGGKKYQLKVDKEKCVKCDICHRVCPMQLSVRDILHQPDCIKCGRCIDSCPKKALSFK